MIPDPELDHLAEACNRARDRLDRAIEELRTAFTERVRTVEALEGYAESLHAPN